MQKIAAIQTRVIGAQTNVAFAETAISTAVREERPAAESRARADLADAARELIAARKNLSEALVAIGLEPNAL